jgi:predicted ATPase
VYLKTLSLRRDEVPSFERYPFSIPAVRGLDTLALDPRVTYFVGETARGSRR